MQRLGTFLRTVAVLACLLSFGGCLTARQQALAFRQPHNRVFRPDVSVAALPQDKKASLRDFDQGGSQSVCLLQLAPDAELTKRYHARHDMTMFVVSGSAIVMVEETRYFVTPGSAVLIPRLTAYSVMPHKTDEEFRALLVYSPPFRGADTVLEK